MDLVGSVSGSISLGGEGGGGINDVLVKETTEYESVVESNKAYIDLSWLASKTDLQSYVTLEDMNDYYDKIEVNSLVNAKQDTLIAGENITIDDNVISATGGGGVDYSESSEVVIGTWFDGRPIYRKVFTNLSYNVSSGTWGNTVTIPNGNDLVGVKCWGSFVVNEYYEIIPSQAHLDMNSGILEVFTVTNATRTIIRMVVDYTKTTD